MFGFMYVLVNSCCYPATNALRITLHKHVGCIPSLASKIDIPCKPDRPQCHRLIQTGPSATEWTRQRKAQASQIGHGTPDWPKQPGPPQHHQLALAAQTAPAPQRQPQYHRLAQAAEGMGTPACP